MHAWRSESHNFMLKLWCIFKTSGSVVEGSSRESVFLCHWRWPLPGRTITVGTIATAWLELELNNIVKFRLLGNANLGHSNRPLRHPTTSAGDASKSEANRGNPAVPGEPCRWRIAAAQGWHSAEGIAGFTECGIFDWIPWNFGQCFWDSLV